MKNRPLESYIKEINKVLGDRESIWLRDIDLQKIRKILQAIQDKFGKGIKKQFPEKVEYYDDGDYAKCPNCGNDDFEYGINNWGCSNCPSCGQALDWNAHPTEKGSAE